MRRWIPITLTVWMAVAGFLVFRRPNQNRVNLSAPMEIWADALRDTNALTASPEQLEQQLGQRLVSVVPVDLPQNAALQPYVDRVGARLLAHGSRRKMPFRFTVREDPELNAFALPGGHIYVNTGLLTSVQSEDELAVVLGHEISHVELRHTAPNTIRDLVSLGYSKYQEFDANEAGVRLAKQAGYNPAAAVALFQRLGSQGTVRSASHTPRSPIGEAAEAMMNTLGTYWHSHPDADERVRRVSHTIGKSR